MLKSTLLFCAFIAIADLLLLYGMYQWFGGWAVFGVIFGSIFVGPWLVAFARGRTQSTPEKMMTAGFGDEILFLAARFLFVYPGPLSTFCALLLLIPAVRLALQAWALRRLTQAIAGGAVTVISGMPGGGFGPLGSAGGMPRDEAVNFGGDFVPGNLKQAQGKVVEPFSELPPPAGNTPEDEQPKS